MDSVRFGRVLGIGARLAGKTLAQAVDAAASPNPRAREAAPAATEPPRPTPGVVIPPVRAAAQKARVTTKNVARGGRKFGEAIWGPMARASGVLWLEVTGVFFGLVAVFGAQGLWLHRAGITSAATHDQRQHFWLAAAMAIVFGYFCVSSFVRASRKSRAYRR